MITRDGIKSMYAMGVGRGDKEFAIGYDRRAKLAS
jgi:hypothetical protein